MTARCNTGSGSLFLFACVGLILPPCASNKIPVSRLGSLPDFPLARSNAVSGEDGLHIVPKRLIDDGLMLAWIALALVDDFTTIDPVLQHQVERTAGERLAAIRAAIGGRPDLADNAGAIEVLLQFAD